jgi:hypothetical protein
LSSAFALINVPAHRGGFVALLRDGLAFLASRASLLVHASEPIRQLRLSACQAFARAPSMICRVRPSRSAISSASLRRAIRKAGDTSARSSPGSNANAAISTPGVVAAYAFRAS